MDFVEHIKKELAEIKKEKEKFKSKKDDKNMIGGAVGPGVNTPGSEKTRIYFSKYISTQQNIDSNYQEAGIIHVSEAIAINALRQYASDWANLIGSKGFDNTLFDFARNNGLQKIESLINKSNQKVANLRMDIVPIDQSLLMLNFYGTLLQKNNS